MSSSKPFPFETSRDDLAEAPGRWEHHEDGAANERKSAASADQWLPPNKAFRCEYVQRQIDVKTTYGLSVTQAERDAMAAVLGGCS